MKSILAEDFSLIDLGRCGENLAREIIFDLTRWREIYGEGVATLIAQLPNQTAPYPCTVTCNGDSLFWHIRSADTSVAGKGKCELSYYVGEQLVKSTVFQTFIAESLAPIGEAPEPYQSWVNEILTAGKDAVAAKEAIESISVSAETVSEESEAGVTKTLQEGSVHLDFQIPRGARGETGAKGESGSDGADGYTPIRGVDYFTEEDIQKFEAICRKEAAAVLSQKAPALHLESETAKTLVLDDVTNATLTELHIYGESSQNGSPTTSEPIEVISIENPKVKITDSDGAVQETTLPYTLRGIKNAADNLVARDEIVLTDGKVTLIQRVYEKIFDGTEAFSTYTSNGNTKFLYNLPKPGTRGSLPLSNKYVGRSVGADALNSGEFSIWVQDGKVASFRDDLYTTAASFKEYLATQYANGTPLVIYYQLAEPIETDITETEGQTLLSLQTKYPVSTVVCDGDIKVTYKADTTNAFHKLLGRISALEAAVVANS